MKYKFPLFLILSLIHLTPQPLLAAGEDTNLDAQVQLEYNRLLILDYDLETQSQKRHTDSLQVLIRDIETGKSLMVELVEDPPRSGHFVGTYHLSFSNDKKISPEVYIISKGKTYINSIKDAEQLIREGFSLRKPFFFRSETKWTQSISIFNTKEQALNALEVFRKNILEQPLIKQAALEAQRKAEKEAERRHQLEEQDQREKERLRLTELELKRKAEMLQRQALLDAEEKRKREAKAETLAQNALQLYKAEKFKEAEALFAQSIELNPSNSTYLYQYAVTLYKNGKYNPSLVILTSLPSTIETKDSNSLEKTYFIALNHMKLKEYDLSLIQFKTVKAKNDKTLSPNAAFFSGIIEFQKENYDQAKEHFEYVLDQSEDKKLDEQADLYIEQIANIKNFLANKAKRFLLTLNTGLMYDSNILSLADSNAPTDLAGWRTLYGGSIEFRPIYNESHEFSAIYNLSDSYSMSSQLAPKVEFQNKDPFFSSLGINYKFKGKFLGKPFVLSLLPSYESTLMNADGVGSRENIGYSQVFTVDQTYVMSEDWFSQYVLETRNDTSNLSSSVGDENATATKISFSTTQSLFKDRKKTRAHIYSGGIGSNNAYGRNQKYQKLDLGYSYIFPWIGNSSLIPRLNLSQVQYPEHVSGRTDTLMGAAITFRRPISTSWALNLDGGMSSNQSKIPSNSYNKFTLMGNLTWSGSL